MYISKKGLTNYLPYLSKKTTPNIVKDLINLGFEVEQVHDFRKDNSNLVVGHVLECIPHPNADKLNLCKVNIGSEILTIVCGASNVRVNTKVIVALNGAKIKGVPFVLEPREIRKILSNGMICSLSELGINSSFYGEEEKDGIIILPNSAQAGDENVFKYLQLDDEFLDISIGTNRNDCNSTYTIARELANLYKVNKDDSKSFTNLDIEPKLNFTKELQILADPKVCNAVLILKIKNVKVEPTPYKFRQKLINLKYNSINNYVDLSNYIMHEIGQPIHFYDANSFVKKMKIDLSAESSELDCLGSIQKANIKEFISIKNDTNQTCCVGGVVGLKNSSITLGTKDIYVEIANWNDSVIRNCTSKSNVSTQASKLFSKPIPIAKIYQAYNLLTKELEDMKKQHYLSDYEVVNAVFNKKNWVYQINLKLEKLNKVLGTVIPRNEVFEYLECIGCKIINKSLSEVLVETPFYRTDLQIAEDLIEEILRLYGLNKIKSVGPFNESQNTKEDELIQIEEKISLFLASNGFQQVKNYSLTNEKKCEFNFFNYQNLIKINNFHSIEQEVMRNSLFFSLVDNLKYNSYRQQKNLAIFEIANIYSNINSLNKQTHLGIAASCLDIKDIHNNKNITSSVFWLKNIILNLFQNFNFGDKLKIQNWKSNSEMIHSYQAGTILIDQERIGYICRLHPNIEKELGLNYPAVIAEINLSKIFANKQERTIFSPISELPSSIRDFSFLLNKNVNIQAILDETKNLIQAYLTESLGLNKVVFELFDLYSDSSLPPGKNSFTFKLTITTFNQPLSENIIKNIEIKVINLITQKFLGIIR